MADTMTTEIYKEIDLLKYESKFLDAKIRADGRDSLSSARQLVEVVPNVVESAIGSASCRIGNTCVIVGITAGVFTPPEGVRTESVPLGKVTVTCDYSLPFPGDRRTAQTEACGISSKLEAVLMNPAVFDRHQLIVRLVGESNATTRPVWDVCANVVVVRDDGCVLDCALLAAIAAVQSVALPALTRSLEIAEDEPSEQLRFNSIPVSITFAQYIDSAEETHWLLDPTKDEEMVFPRLSIVVANEEVVGLYGLEGPRTTGITTSGSFSMSDVITHIWATAQPEVTRRIAAVSH